MNVVWQISPQEANTIIAALSEQPYRLVGELIPKLVVQSNASIEAQQARASMAKPEAGQVLPPRPRGRRKNGAEPTEVGH